MGLLWHGGVEGKGWELKGLEELDGSADGGDGVCEDQGIVLRVVEEEGVEVEVFLHEAAFDDAFFEVLSHLGDRIHVDDVLGEILLIIGVVEVWLVEWQCYEIMYLVKSRNDRMREQSTIYDRFWHMVYLDGFSNTLCLRWPGLLCMYCTPSYSSYLLSLTCSIEQHYLFSHVYMMSLGRLSLMGECMETL